MLYFAYGSNLHAADLGRFCADHGFEPMALVGRPALLPDHRPAFHYYSASRQGGALDAAYSIGDVCPGALFELSSAQVGVLDAKESAGVNYERRDVVAYAGGELVPAFTYCVREERRGGFVPPSADYLNIVAEGYETFGHAPTRLLRAAEGRRPEPVRRVFVYGTLMRGESRHHFLTGGAATPARLAGMSLVDLAEFGDYPGMRRQSAAPQSELEDERRHEVRGEVYAFDAASIPALLRKLDEVEDFLGFDDLRSSKPRSMYERTLCEVLGELAWTYTLRPDFGGPRIPSGDWRNR